MIKVLLSLFLIGHFLGDFYLQTSNLAIKKDKSIKGLFKHSIIYLLSLVFVIIPIFSLNLLRWSFVIAGTHLLIDLVKFFVQKNFLKDQKVEAVVFFIDQIIHVLIIFFAVTVIYFLSEPINYTYFIQYALNILKVDFSKILSWILALLIIIQPISITIKKMLYRYRPLDNAEEGVPNAGALIGILERCIILLFLAVGQYSAIGFVLTAKSIARYNKIADNPKFSEYYLLGTLLSTMLVILVYLIIFYKI